MKKFIKKMLPLLYFSVFLSILAAPTVHAYLDPATTSYIIQIVAGIFIALGTVVGVFWKKISRFFKNLKVKGLEKKIARQAAKKDKINNPEQ